MRTQQFGKLETAPFVIPLLSQKLKKLYFQILLFASEKSGFTRPRPWVNGKTPKYLIVKVARRTGCDFNVQSLLSKDIVTEATQNSIL
jgi:hypothetical protein